MALRHCNTVGALMRFGLCVRRCSTACHATHTAAQAGARRDKHLVANIQPSNFKDCHRIQEHFSDANRQPMGRAWARRRRLYVCSTSLVALLSTARDLVIGLLFTAVRVQQSCRRSACNASTRAPKTLRLTHSMPATFRCFERQSGRYGATLVLLHRVGWHAVGWQRNPRTQPGCKRHRVVRVQRNRQRSEP